MATEEQEIYNQLLASCCLCWLLSSKEAGLSITFWDPWSLFSHLC